jgi:asparagine synthase (glutamine-hydrolysing)
MCGIFGFVGEPGRAETLDLDAALVALRHRGPDDQGTYRVCTAGGAIACAFAHTRLSVIDLSSAGHQPMTSEDGRHTIVYNGEVYNFGALREELLRDGESFRSRTDTEVILRAYARWGAECVERLDGMFSLALFDRERATLLLARDRLGIKPLYYSMGPQGIVFSSEVRALLATRVVGRALSPEGLRSYLEFGSVADPHTLLEDVKSLLPGHVLEWRGGQGTTRRYWALPDGVSREISFDEAVEELSFCLRRAVTSHLAADVPLGVFLSGGIDSSAVTGFASEAMPRPVHTFTVTFDEMPYSEERYAAEVAARFGCEHHAVRLSADAAAAQFGDALAAMDQPSADGINTYFVAQAAREAGLTVALSGLGGDETFAGYQNFRRFARYRSVGAAAGRLPSRLLSSLSNAAAAPSRSNRARKLAALASASGEAHATYAALRGMFTRPQIERLLSPESLELVSRARPQPEPNGDGPADAVNLYSRLELEGYLRNTLLRDTDAMSMAHALEVRVPLLDKSLVELLATIPGALKVSGRVNKALLVAASPSLPPSVSGRPKMGFVLPLDRWFRGPLSPLLDETFAAARGRLFASNGAGGAEGLREAFLRGEQRVSHSRILCLLALARWCTEHRIDLPSARPERTLVGLTEAARPRKGAPPRPRILLGLPGAFSGVGGIEMYNRLVIRACLEWAEERGASCEVLVANDEEGAADERYCPGGSAAVRGFAKRRLRFGAALLARARALAPDLIMLGHVNFARLGPALAAASPSSKVWYLTYGIDVWYPLDRLSRRMLRRADKVLAISDYTRRELVKHNGVPSERVELLPCALDPFWQEDFERFAAEPPIPGPPRLLTVARLAASEGYKGVDSVIRALPEIAKSAPDVAYEVIGDGDDRPRLEALAAKLGVAARVVFRGRVSREEIARAYAECSLFVMPSSREGFGIVFLEAALFGKASIAGRHGGSPEVVEDGVAGVLVDHDDVGRLSVVVAELLRDRPRLRALGDAAHARLYSEFQYERMRRSLCLKLGSGPGEVKQTSRVAAAGQRGS